MEPRFTDADIHSYRGDQALEKLRHKNDQHYMTERGILKVSEERWGEAQRYERKTWMDVGRNLSDDRNKVHESNFDGYRCLAGTHSL